MPWYSRTPHSTSGRSPGSSTSAFSSSRRSPTPAPIPARRRIDRSDAISTIGRRRAARRREGAAGDGVRQGPDQRVDRLPTTADPRVGTLLDKWSSLCVDGLPPDRETLDVFALRPWLGHIRDRKSTRL